MKTPNLSIGGDRRREIYLTVPNHIQQRNNIRSAGKVLQDLDFALDLLLLDWLQHLDDAFLVVDDIDALEDLRVLPPSCRYAYQ